MENLSRTSPVRRCPSPENISDDAESDNSQHDEDIPVENFSPKSPKPHGHKNGSVSKKKKSKQTCSDNMSPSVPQAPTVPISFSMADILDPKKFTGCPVTGKGQVWSPWKEHSIRDSEGNDSSLEEEHSDNTGNYNRDGIISYLFFISVGFFWEIWIF